MTMFNLSRRDAISRRLWAALKLHGGEIVVRDTFPDCNDRKLARRVVESDARLQFCTVNSEGSGMGTTCRSVVSVIMNGVQP